MMFFLIKNQAFSVFFFSAAYAGKGRDTRPKPSLKPPPRNTFTFLVGRTFRQQLIRLENQTCTHYNYQILNIYYEIQNIKNL